MTVYGVRYQKALKQVGYYLDGKHDGLFCYLTKRATNKFQKDNNLTVNGTGATYTATIKYYPIDADRTIVIQGIATLDLTISNNGENGAEGAPAKLLQLIGTGTYFTYHYDGNLVGSQTITLTAEKNSSVSGVHWYCKKAKWTKFLV